MGTSIASAVWDGRVLLTSLRTARLILSGIQVFGSCAAVPDGLMRGAEALAVFPVDRVCGWHVQGGRREETQRPGCHRRGHRRGRAWNPRPGGYPYINAIAVSGATVYVGGSFDRVGGKKRENVAALDGVSGAAKRWNPGANNFVFALAVSGSTVYLGGQFDRVGGRVRPNAAAVDAVTGRIRNWNPSPDSGVYVLVVSGPTVYLGGNFSRVGRLARTNVAAVDGITGQPTPWAPLRPL